MADHSKPTLSSTYPNFLNEVKGRLEDISRQFDPAQGAASNVVAGTVRWSSSSKKWEQWNGTAWGDLATEYAINTSGSAAKLKTARSIAVSGGATAAAVPFDGSANVTLNVTALNPAQLSAVVPVNKGGTGSATAEQARVNLGLGSAATTNAADYAAKSHAHAWGEITGKPATFPPAGHSHRWGEITGKPSTFPPAGHAHSWGEITGKPGTFPPIIGGAANQAKAGNWTPSWSEVQGRPNLMEAGAVGSYALVTKSTSNGAGARWGETVSGSILSPASLSMQDSGWRVRVHGLKLAGTWRVMSSIVESHMDSSSSSLSLAVRIA